MRGAKDGVLDVLYGWSLGSLVRLPFLARPAAVAAAEEMGLTGWRPPEYEEDMRGHNHVAHALRFRTVMHPREGERERGRGINTCGP